MIRTVLLASPRSKVAAYADGYSGAPVATVQYPSLLNGYAARPPWKVAGVDYAVGYPTGTSLTDWRGLSGTGISSTASQLRLNGVSGHTFDSIDFSLGGGAQLLLTSSPNTIISNCKFGGTNLASLSTGVIDNDAGGMTVTNCIIDGGATGGADAQAALIWCRAPGTVLLQYNWFKNYPNEIISLNGSGTLTYKWNFIDNCVIETSGHQNYLQASGNGAAITSIIKFNTSRQTLSAGGEGFQFYNNQTGTNTSPVCSNNTMICTGTPGYMSYMIHGWVYAGNTNNGTALAQSNYFDTTGAYGAFYGGSLTGWTISGNVNMLTGAAQNS